MENRQTASMKERLSKLVLDKIDKLESLARTAEEQYNIETALSRFIERKSERINFKIQNTKIVVLEDNEELEKLQKLDLIKIIGNDSSIDIDKELFMKCAYKNLVGIQALCKPDLTEISLEFDYEHIEMILNLIRDLNFNSLDAQLEIPLPSDSDVLVIDNLINVLFQNYNSIDSYSELRRRIVFMIGEKDRRFLY